MTWWIRSRRGSALPGHSGTRTSSAAKGWAGARGGGGWGGGGGGGPEPAAPGSAILKRSIALCRCNVQYAEIATEVEVGKLDGLQKRIPARVVRFPFYDPEKKRPRS